MTGPRGPRRARPVAPSGAGARGAIVGGRRAVAEAIRAGLVEEVLIAVGARSTPGLRDLRAEARQAGVSVRETTARLLDSLAPAHQGVAAQVRMPRPMGERELRTWSFDEDALVVILDGVTDPQNLGAAARAAEAAPFGPPPVRSCISPTPGWPTSPGPSKPSRTEASPSSASTNARRPPSTTPSVHQDLSLWWWGRREQGCPAWCGRRATNWFGSPCWDAWPR